MSLVLPTNESLPQATKLICGVQKYSVVAGSYLQETDPPAIKAIVPRMNITSARVGIHALIRTAFEAQNPYAELPESEHHKRSGQSDIVSGGLPVQLLEILIGFLVGPGLRTYLKLSSVMSATIAGLGRTGHFSKLSNEALEFVRRRGRAWLNHEWKELHEQLKALAFNTLYTRNSI